MKKKTKKILLIIIVVATILCSLGLIRHIVNNRKEDLKELKLNYDVGAISETGKYVESESTLYTKELFKCLGLEVEIDFNSNVEYEIYFYDYNKEFISSTGKLQKNFKDKLDETYVYARIMITPLNDEDEKIGVFEKHKYTKQLDVTVLKNQYKSVFLLNKQEVSDSLFTTGACIEVTNNDVTRYYKLAKYSDNTYSVDLDLKSGDKLVSLFVDGNDLSSSLLSHNILGLLGNNSVDYSDVLQYTGSITAISDVVLTLKFGNIAELDLIDANIE